MSEIFLSYCHHDSERAMQLADRLRMAGFDVWIHEGAIQGADQWSKEIVDAIEACKVFLLVLSQESFASKHVLSELSIASESERTILPIEIGELTIPNAFRYQLAGIQRTQISDFEGILRSLNKLGFGESRSEVHNPVSPDSGTGHRTSITDPRKSLIVLPFEDLSPSNDNGWFADGLMSELIESLAKIKSLRLIDRKTSMDLKGFRGKTMQIADAMQVRYFIEGNVRKFGDQIKISVQLLDIETGEYLWQDSHRGDFKDVFDLQESVAKKVVEGLQLTLTQDEQAQLSERGTENADAYEFAMRGQARYEEHTFESYKIAATLFEEAILCDASFVNARLNLALIRLEMFRLYRANTEYLHQALAQIAEAAEIDGESARVSRIRSILAMVQDDSREALRWALRAVELQPDLGAAYGTLGRVYRKLGMHRESMDAMERSLEHSPNEVTAMWSALIAFQEAGEDDRLRNLALRGVTVFERYLKLRPDDYHARVQYANVLRMAEEHSLAVGEAEKLESEERLDGQALYNLACLLLSEGLGTRALVLLRKCVASGYRPINLFTSDPDLDAIRNLPEFQHLLNDLNIIRSEMNESNG